VALAGGAYWLARVRPWENGRGPGSPADGPPPAGVTSGPGPADGQRAAPPGGQRAAPGNGHEPVPARGEPAASRAGDPDLDNDSAPSG
jgi:hypothetical protein